MSYNKRKRIELVDAVRGFALFGILLLHSIEHFDFYRNAEMNPEFFKPVDPLLASYGRMSLTSYVLQALIGVPLFYGFGLAIYRYFGSTLSFIYAILFFVFQLYFCKIWFKHFHYGPLEWIWRALTYFDFSIRLKKLKE